MASEMPQQKEWVPRSHKAGAFGTLTRAAAKQAKIFTQFLEEEQEEKIQKTRDLYGSYVEIAFITCKFNSDGARVAKLMAQQFEEGAAGEAYHSLFVIQPGTATSNSLHLYISVGSTVAFEDMYRVREEKVTQELIRLTKSYNSVLFTSVAPPRVKDLVDVLNKQKGYNVDLLESREFRIPGGWKGAKRFCEKLEETMVIRIEDLSFKDEDGMDAYTEAMGTLYSSPHRLTITPAYRATTSPGEVNELTCVISYTLKRTEKDLMTIIFDDVDTYAKDKEVIDGSESIKAGLGQITGANYYFAGPGADAPVVKQAIADAKKKKFFAAAPKVVF